ncbi:MAG: N-6 DNA methylase, partial [Bryobacterales bacterium]|nr:N-6 DNA methylase [Bryobacterales bacterium]
KALGAYYTDAQVADFLVTWALRGPLDTLLDPSFGGGVFLRSAGKRMLELGGEPGQRIFGVELASDVHSHIQALLTREFCLPSESLLHSDFFDVVPGRLPKVDVVVGNPPFIRYQRFTGLSRQKALRRAAEEGLKLSSLTSSWLPFLVHSMRFLRASGRLAMVVPAEIAHASYARPILRHLACNFNSVTFLTFRSKLFADLSEDTILLLAEGRREGGGVPDARFQLLDLDHAGELTAIRDRREWKGLQTLRAETLVTGEERLIVSLIPSKTRDLYRELSNSQRTLRLGEAADVGIGYVTGANDFFHLSPEQAKSWSIPKRFLRPCVRRGRAFSGLSFTEQDWVRKLPHGESGFLLELPAKGELPSSVAAYLHHGLSRRVHQGFKCSNRSPWYRVPHVYRPDGFLTYMSGDTPRLVTNEAGAVAPNTLHILRVRANSPVTAPALAALWQTSLTQLSTELEGHALGGGMLKLEPTEAERLIIPFVNDNPALSALSVELDGLARSLTPAATVTEADRILLRHHLGLSARDVRLLHEAATLLRGRRRSRSSSTA